MSVLKQPFATPSRVRGIYRYLLSLEGQSEARDILERTMSPHTLIRGGKKSTMIHDTVGECTKMGLLIEESGTVAINPNLPDPARDSQTGDSILPITLSNLFFSGKNEENHNLGKIISWYLSRDIYDAPGNWNEVEEAFREQAITDKLGVTSDVRYGQFEDWICYLGFAWCHSRKMEKMLMPDPTAHIRGRLDELFEDKESLPIADAVRKLADICPVFEGGILRMEIEQNYAQRDERSLSSSTSHAWLRLQDEGIVKLVEKSDAEMFIFIDGGTKRRYSEIKWLGGDLKK